MLHILRGIQLAIYIHLQGFEYPLSASDGQHFSASAESAEHVIKLDKWGREFGKGKCSDSRISLLALNRLYVIFMIVSF